MRYLVTGVSGFVSGYFIEHISKADPNNEIWGIDIREPADSLLNLCASLHFFKMSLLDRGALRSLLKEFRPDRVVHLAAYSSVAYSWENPVESFLNNTNIFLNLVEAIREVALDCRILSVGSSEEYGQVSQGDLPLSETRCPTPFNPYAVARVSQEHLSKVYAQGYGLSVLCTRSFNHIGPGQIDTYVVSSLVRQAIEIAHGLRDVIVCGELKIVRDFIDVRDAVRAYALILEKGVSGQVYNVCSGSGISLYGLLKKISEMTGILLEITTDVSLIRPLDNPIIVGDNSKLAALGFKREYDLDRTLSDLIEWWKKKYAIN